MVVYDKESDDGQVAHYFHREMEELSEDGASKEREKQDG